MALSGAPLTRSMRSPPASSCKVAVELVSELERNGVNPAATFSLDLPVEAELCGEGIERRLGRVALDLPGAI